MTDTISPQAGWYPDPTDARAYRWWSGGAWTDHLTAAPQPRSAWSEPTDAGPTVAVDVDTLDFPPFMPGPSPRPIASVVDQHPSTTITPAAKNRAGYIVIVIGLIAVAAYLGSVALAYSTVIPLIPGIIGLIGAVPAFRQARVTGDGLAVSLLGVLLSGTATVLAVLPLLPAILGLPSASDVTDTTNAITQAISFHTTVESQIAANAQKDFGQAATSAACPADVIATPGANFTCTEVLADGSTAAVTVTVTTASGKVSWVPAA